MKDVSDDEQFLPTRQSLLSRLRNQGDQAGWQEFFETYWRLIYGVGRKSGLSDAEAQDLVQETMLVVVRHMPEFRYDPAKGSFKGWLHTVIRSRLSEHWRKVQGLPRMDAFVSDTDSRMSTDFLHRIPDEVSGGLDAVWQAEWEQNLLENALRKVKSETSPKHYLIFSMAVLKEVPLRVIAEKLDVNYAQIYLAKHRVAKAVKTELQRLHKQTEKTGI